MQNNKGKWIAKAIIFKAALFSIMALVVMLLWNNIVVISFGLKSLSYLQSMGLLLLVRILTGNIGPGGHRGPGGMMNRKGFMGEHWKNMSNEEKKQWMQGMGKRFEDKNKDTNSD